MDKVRVALNWIVAHHFWLLSGLIVLLGFGIWYLAKSDLSAKYTANMQEINRVFDDQRSISNRTFHPNDKVNEGQKREIEELIREVTKTWQELYQRQREEALVWPAQLAPSFRSYISSRKFGDFIDVAQRQDYFQYIRGRFDDLPALINANKIDPSTPGAGGGGFSSGEGGRRFGGGFGGGGGGGFGGPEQEIDPTTGQPIDPDYTVYWSPEDQGRIRDELTSDRVQSHWRIWTTQEDLWVYETLLRAIAATNEAKQSTRRSNAAIIDLGSMEVGKLAAAYSRTPGRIHRLETQQSAGEGDGEMSLQSMGDTSSEETGEGEMGSDEYAGVLSGTGQGQLTPAQEKAAFLSRRYINREGKPIPVPADEEPLDPTLFGTEFKQLPVRLRVRMDTRWINHLIVEMANSPMKIMVTEVRVAPRNVEGGAGGGGGGYARGFGGGGYGGAQSMLFDESAVYAFDRQPFMKEVILQGVVQIFNEPNPAAFGPVEGAEESGSLVAN